MFKVTLKGLLQHPIRFLLTLFAVVAGVSFVVASFTLTDTVRSQFNRLFEDSGQGIDLTVRGRERFDSGPFGTTAPVPEALQSEIDAVPGVRAAVGVVEGFPSLVIGPDGKAVSPIGGAPPLGINWPETELNDLFIVEEGERPLGPGEVAFDRDLFKMSGYSVGDTVVVQTPQGNGEFRLVGVFAFGEDNATVGATLTAFSTAEAQAQFNLAGKFSRIEVAVDDGADVDEVSASIAALLPPDYEVVPIDELVAEQQAEVGEIIDIFGTVLTVFAGISLFVAAFLIFNTFLIIVGQRVRELALLRALGASSMQVATSLVGEALVIGVLASILGFLAGLVLSLLLNTVLGSVGLSSGESSLVVSPTAVVAAFAVGIGTTLASSLLPAFWATRIPPVAAMREGFRLSMGSLKVLGAIGSIMLVLGGAAMAAALFGSLDTAPMFIVLGVGAFVVFIGAALLSAAVAGPVARLLGWPFKRIYKVTGEIARENAAREPSRTAFTAAALMIGLALVSMSFVVGGSLRESFISTLRSSVSADWYVTSDNFIPFSPQVIERMQADPALTSVSGIYQGAMEVDGAVRQFSSMDYAVLPEVIDLDVVEGEVVDQPGILVKTDAAEQLGVGPGDTLTVTFQETGDVELPVLAVYDDSSVVGNWMVDKATYEGNFTDQTSFMAVARTAPGASAEEARAALNEAIIDYPQLTVRDVDEFTASQEDQLNQLLAVIFVFLFLAIIIAVMGIVNTLALSVFERTRELGLLRAVGMQPRQVRRMIRLEAVIVAVFGALLGIAVGVVFGVTLATAIPDDVISIIDVPVPSLIVFVILAALAGVVAAVYPAWRAGRLNVLEAIATE